MVSWWNPQCSRSTETETVFGIAFLWGLLTPSQTVFGALAVISPRMIMYNIYIYTYNAYHGYDENKPDQRSVIIKVFDIPCVYIYIYTDGFIWWYTINWITSDLLFSCWFSYSTNNKGDADGQLMALKAWSLYQQVLIGSSLFNSGTYMSYIFVHTYVALESQPLLVIIRFLSGSIPLNPMFSWWTPLGLLVQCQLLLARPCRKKHGFVWK